MVSYIFSEPRTFYFAKNPMGHFSLKKKKKSSIDLTAEASRTKNHVTDLFKFTLYKKPDSRDTGSNTMFHSKSSLKPVLHIDTRIPNMLTPPPSPAESRQSSR